MPTDPPRVHRKEWPDAPDGFFEAEAAGLRWLADAEAAGGARTARVLDAGAGFIELESVPRGPVTAAAAEAFGRALAATHAAGADAFGSPADGWRGDAWIGRQAQRNDPSPTWGAFYAEQRVLPFVRAALDRGTLDPAGARVVEAVARDIAAGTHDDDRPPARIHGDLWSGNVLWSPSGAVLIDPAAHGGHGLTDVAMLELFGCPGLDRITAAYAEAAGLTRGWRDVVGLHQLHPLAVHAVSHGPAYAAQLVSVARSYL
ncbi:MAG TPA: fructosamine kinase family protein [Dermatophilaceae bacterium]|nr:fructosamine kinase family protein [Dermatophilaceae bacterium]